MRGGDVMQCGCRMRATVHKDTDIGDADGLPERVRSDITFVKRLAG